MRGTCEVPGKKKKKKKKKKRKKKKRKEREREREREREEKKKKPRKLQKARYEIDPAGAARNAERTAEGGNAVVPLFLSTCRFAWWRRVPAGAFDSSRAVDRVRVRSWRGQKEEERERERERERGRREEETIERELESGVYRGAPGGPLATRTLNVGGTAGAPPGCFSPAYLTYVRAGHLLILLPLTVPLLPQLPLLSFSPHYHSACRSSPGPFFSRHHHPFPRAYLARSCLREIRIFDGQFLLLLAGDRGNMV